MSDTTYSTYTTKEDDMYIKACKSRTTTERNHTLDDLIA